MDEDALKKQVPNKEDLYNPTLEALRELGGSGSNAEIYEQARQLLDLPDDVAEFPHLGSHTQTELEYRLAWARTSLKKYGVINNPQSGLWVLTPKGRATVSVDPEKVREHNRALAEDGGADETVSQIEVDEEHDWKERLLNVVKAMDPSAFERLCQRLLRESGFVEVEVTGRTGDGGIDGRGIIRFKELLTFPIVFQCKRYDGAVGSSAVRNFRGAMDGRADRGLIMTTGRFTLAAQEEASRDGVQPVDLIDGYQLAERLKDLGLGVQTMNRYIVDEAWFEDI